MKSTILNAVSFQSNATPANSLPANFAFRLLLSLPLMVVAGLCLFGFVGTFEPMPRIAQLSWRAIDVCAGLGSVLAICWLWLKPRRGD